MTSTRKPLCSRINRAWRRVSSRKRCGTGIEIVGVDHEGVGAHPVVERNLESPLAGHQLPGPQNLEGFREVAGQLFLLVEVLARRKLHQLVERPFFVNRHHVDRDRALVVHRGRHLDRERQLAAEERPGPFLIPQPSAPSDRAKTRSATRHRFDRRERIEIIRGSRTMTEQMAFILSKGRDENQAHGPCRRLPGNAGQALSRGVS